MSQTLYIFLDDQSFTPPVASLVLSDAGEFVNGYEKRSLEDLKTLQDTSKVIVVLPSTIAKPHIVTLPTLKKANLTVPNILEEELIQDQSELHFSLMQHLSFNKHYLVNVIDKNALTDILNLLNEAGFYHITVTNDYIFTDKDTVCLSPYYVLWNSLNGTSVLPTHLFEQFLSKTTEETQFLAFNDTPTSLLPLIEKYHNVETKSCSYREYLCHTHITHPPSDLLKGEFEQTSGNSKRLPLVSYTFASLAALLFLVNNGIQFFETKSKLSTLQQQTMTLYHDFFPNSTAMVSPRFRIEQLLKGQSLNTQNLAFFSLLSPLNQLLSKNTQINISTLTYQNSGLDVEIKANSFHALDGFRDQLKSKSITIKQLNAKSEKKWVIAHWRLTQ